MLSLMTIALDAEAEADFSPRPRDARLLRLHRYWAERRGARRFPSRRDVDPVDFSYLLGNVMLVDVLREPLGFRVRLHGTNLAEQLGFDLTNKVLDYPSMAQYRYPLIERCEVVMQTGSPMAVRHKCLVDGRVHDYEALWLPLSSDGNNVTMLLCAVVFHRAGATVTSRPPAILRDPASL